MNAITKTLAITACSIPLVALAQTLPADQPRSDLERKQTTETGQATKYGGPGTDTGGSMSKPNNAMTKSTRKSMTKPDTTKGKQPTGDVPTYPAPTSDGKSTK